MSNQHSSKHPYDPVQFPEGTIVKIAELPVLERFRQTWKAHDPLQPAQLDYAGKTDVVEKSGIYFGGDVIYKLRNAPGVWHQACLLRA